jgi:hypothetical protein
MNFMENYIDERYNETGTLFMNAALYINVYIHIIYTHTHTYIANIGTYECT